MIVKLMNDFSFAGLLFVAGLSFFLSWFGTGRVREYALRANLLDTPNARSSHVVATPRGGGLAVVFTVALVIALLAFAKLVALDLLFAGLLMCVMAAMGWVDDRRGLSAKFRLIVQAACALAVIVMITSNVVSLSVQNVVWLLVLVLFIVWMTNLYNFMDGIDGIFGIQAATVSIASIILMWQSGLNDDFFVYMAILGSSIGFLIWNWSPAKIFMGDVGSASIGFLLGALAVIAVLEGRIAAVTILIVHAAFIGDATATLVVRFIRGQKIHEAHKSHFYQKLHQSGRSHSGVATLFGLYNIFWLLPVAYIFSIGRIPNWLSLVLAYGPILVAAVKYRAGFDNPANASVHSAGSSIAPNR